MCEVSLVADTDDPAVLASVAGVVREVLNNPQGADLGCVADGEAAPVREKIERLREHFAAARAAGRAAP